MAHITQPSPDTRLHHRTGSRCAARRIPCALTRTLLFACSVRQAVQSNRQTPILHGSLAADSDSEPMAIPFSPRAILYRRAMVYIVETAYYSPCPTRASSCRPVFSCAPFTTLHAEVSPAGDNARLCAIDAMRGARCAGASAARWRKKRRQRGARGAVTARSTSRQRPDASACVSVAA